MAETALDALFNQAADAHRHRDLATAERLCREIVAADPNHLRALFALATIEFDHGHHAEAESVAARIVAIDPAIADAHNLRAAALAALGKLADAADSFGKAAAASTDPAPAFYNRGNLLFELGRIEEALLSYDAALLREPDFPATHNNRGNVLRELNRPAEALAAYDRSIALDPNYADALNNRGIVLQTLDRSADALTSFERARTLSPKNAEIHYNLGVALSRLNRPSDALVCHDRAVALQPDHADAAGAAFSVAASLCDWRDYARRTADLTARIKAGQRVAPFAALNFSDDPALQMQAAIATARSFDRIAAQAQPFKQRPPHSRLRLAYLSADFTNHVVGHTLVELFERHDRTRFEIYGMSLRKAPESAIRRRLVAAFDRFADADTWSDSAAVRYLRENEIDIAIDLMGYTEGSRLGIFARRAAPVQINYFGYPGTSGAAFIDYFVADRVALPATMHTSFSERVVYLPDCYLATAAGTLLDEPITARDTLGLPAKGFVFCCFNACQKITPAVFDVWMRLLGQIEGSVLWLYAKETAQPNLRREAQTRGIDPQRLVFAPPVERAAHLSRSRAADLFVDTLPYNAHNTACEALWAGLPLVTCTGHAFGARVAISVLAAAGLSELVTASLEEYERLALTLARDPARMTVLRAKIAAARTNAALFDGDRYRRHLEAAFHAIAERQTRNETPASFAIQPLD